MHVKPAPSRFIRAVLVLPIGCCPLERGAREGTPVYRQ